MAKEGGRLSAHCAACLGLPPLQQLHSTRVRQRPRRAGVPPSTRKYPVTRYPRLAQPSRHNGTLHLSMQVPGRMTAVTWGGREGGMTVEREIWIDGVARAKRQNTIRSIRSKGGNSHSRTQGPRRLHWHRSSDTLKEELARLAHRI